MTVITLPAETHFQLRELAHPHKIESYRLISLAEAATAYAISACGRIYAIDTGVGL